MKTRTMRERLLPKAETIHEIYLDELDKEIQRILAEREEANREIRALESSGPCAAPASSAA